MLFKYLLVAGSFQLSTLAWSTHIRRGVDCIYLETPESGDTCESFSSMWGLSVDDLESLNPGIDCDDLDTDQIYCVIGSVDNTPTSAEPTSTNPTSTFATEKPVIPTLAPTTTLDTGTIASTTTSASNGVVTPQPTQPGMVSNCSKFHFVAAGVTCSQVTSYQKITQADLVSWNPTVLDDCSGLWGGVHVCVGVLGGHVTTISKSPTPTSAGNGDQTPQPTQPGMISNCGKFHWVAQGVTCNQIVTFQRISLTDFVKWNPTVGSDCRSMQSGVNVCVGLIGVNSPTSTSKPTPTTSASNGIPTPQPTQPGMIKGCKKFHYVGERVTCSQIISYNKISLGDFTRWNTGVGSDCRNMWAKTYVCVSI
jgi:hypothetical protein